VTKVTDFYWQTASTQGYKCWNGDVQVPLTDFLSSPNTDVFPGDVNGPMFGDSGPATLTKGGSAGVAIAALVVVLGLVGVVGYFVGYKRVWLERRAKRFQRFDDGLGGGGGGGGVTGEALNGGGESSSSAPRPPAAPALAPLQVERQLGGSHGL